jgi:hypothetical protein
MRTILIATLAAGGIGLLGTSASLGAPVSGTALRDSAATTVMVERVVTYHVVRTSRRMYSRRSLGAHACHVRRTSYARRGRC